MSGFRGSIGNWASAAVFALAAMAVASPAEARVKHAGTWPDADKAVTLDVTATPRTEALRKLADAAGWSLVVHAPPGDPVEIHVKQAPASKVLDVLLDDGDYVVTRDGNLVSIERGRARDDDDDDDDGHADHGPRGASVPPLPPLPPVPPVPPVPPAAQAAAGPSASAPGRIQSGDKGDKEAHGHGQDRTVMGGDMTIAKGEVVHDVTVFGGNLVIDGDATGTVTVFGGDVTVHDGARVHGDATVFGGTLHLDEGSRVGGDVYAVGGELERDPGSQVGGDVTVKGGKDDDDDDGAKAKPKGVVARAGESVMSGLRLAAVLFVIGTVLLALTGRRMDMLRAEVATRPMKSLALGLVGIVGSIVVVVALCVTIIGIPVAVVGLLVFGFSILGAMCAVLSVVGEALLRHKTENPYVHLAVGCGIFVALAALPWVGCLVVIATILAGIGVLVATRGAGFLRKRNGPSSYPPSEPGLA